MRFKAKIFVVCLLLGLTFANLAAAALVNCGGYNPDGTAQTACEIKDLVFLIERIINFLLAWAWLVSIFYVMWAGYNMIFSGGNSEAIISAKTIFRNAIIGFFIIMGSYLLINWVVSLLTGDSTPRPGSFDIIRSLLPLPK